MPHVREVRQTPHEDHDAMLVAALAAGDLTADDRDQAVALVEGCADCASLHRDLQAIARATSSLPPPIRMPARDFRLSPQQAARIRPGGWRRFLPTGFARAAFTRPLGVGLATFGLIGLLVTNVPIGFSLGGASSAAAPYGAETAGGGAGAAGPATVDRNAAAPSVVDSQLGRSAASAAAYAAGSAAASAAPVPDSTLVAPRAGDSGSGSVASASALPGTEGATAVGSGKVSVAAGSGPTPTEALPVTQPVVRDNSSGTGLSAGDLRNVVFILAIAIGLGLLVLARRARRLA